MRTVIAGSRRGLHREDVIWAIEHAIESEGFAFPTEVGCGCAPGADEYGAEWADAEGVHVETFPAPWDDVEGRPEAELRRRRDGSVYWVRAGFERNEKMALWASTGRIGRSATHGQLIAVQARGSGGTADMIERGRRLGLHVFHYDLDANEYFVHVPTVPF